MANIVILTDTSLSVGDDNTLSIRLSQLSTNRLTFNDKNELTLKDVSVAGYLPLNGLVGEPDVPMERIGCDSSVTRLANYNDANGDVNETGKTGNQEHDGVNVIGLFTTLGVTGLNVTFWDKEYYANGTVAVRKQGANNW